MPQHYSHFINAGKILITLSFLACSSMIHAQANNSINDKEAEDVISSDRPGFVESSTVMKKGRFQLESGLGYAKSRQDNARERTTTSPFLIRYGSADTWELRLESDGWTRQANSQDQQPTTIQKGYADLAIGIKWHMQDADENSAKPAIAWLAHLDLTTGSRAFRAQALSPSLRMVAEWELADDLGFAMMPGWAWDKDDAGKRYSRGILGFTLSHAINRQWNTYVELSGEQLAAKQHGGSIISYGAGVSYIVNSELQVDFSMSKLKSGNAPDWQAGLGFSLRF